MNVDELRTHGGSSGPIRIYALGRLEVLIDGVPWRFGRTAPRKPLELLKSLLALGGRHVNQHVVCDALWPDADGYDSYRSLITTVYRLRRLLHHREAIGFCGARLALDARLCWVDAWAFERDLADQHDSSRLEAAVALYRGRFLGDDDHPHAFEARDRMQRKFVRAALALGQRYETTGDLDGAIALYERALDIEAVSEDIHRRLIDCLGRAGRTAAAVAVYQRCRTLLAQRLGLAPCSATELVFRSLRAA